MMRQITLIILLLNINLLFSQNKETPIDIQARKDIALMITQSYKMAPFDKRWKLQAYEKKKVLHISLERNRMMNMKPSIYNTKQLKELQNLEKIASKDLAYLIYKNYLASTENSIQLNSQIYNKIVFEFYFPYGDNTTSNLELSLLPFEMIDIGFPVLKKNFDKRFK